MLTSIILVLEIFLLASVISTSALTILVPKWELRGYHSLHQSWRKYFIIATIVSMLSAISFNYALNDGTISLLFGVFSFFVTFAGITDFKLHLIPKEMTHLALFAGLAGMIFSLTTGHHILGYVFSDNPLKESIVQELIWLCLFTIIIGVSVLFGLTHITDLQGYYLLGFYLVWVIGVLSMMYILLGITIIYFIQIGATLFYIRDKNKKLSQQWSPFYPPLAIGAISGALFWAFTL